MVISSVGRVQESSSQGVDEWICINQLMNVFVQVPCKKDEQREVNSMCG